ncbi:MAG: VCBS repeat-containing protein [Saprospiraceae bacterium]
MTYTFPKSVIRLTILYSVLPFLFLFCQKKPTEIELQLAATPKTAARFTYMPSEETGVNFSNILKEDFDYNIYTYEYMYNGCGVAAGDVNGDHLPDLYFASGFGPNALYLNLGNFKFLDVTKESGVEAIEGFKTGVTMADVNGDGKLDIYSCRTSKDNDGKKTNFLFINKGNKEINGVQVPIFEEEAKQLGLDDISNTNHACFFDYDRDGDLDLFLLNHRIGFTLATQMRLQQGNDGNIIRITKPETPFESNKFYKNDHGHFTEVTAAAGVTSSAFGLSATVADINQDGWPDLYVANDYIEPDFILINNKNGTFTDHYKDYLKHSSQNSMGSDVADFNNDGLMDIMVLDMKPEDPIRYKELLNIMQYDRYNLLVQYGYGRQVGRNVLQLNNGNNTFSEIGQYSGVAATDWSWSPLFADFDNDGWKDIYITNGYRKDVSNSDYMNFFRDSMQKAGGLTPDRFPKIQDFLKYLPEQKISNYLYINSGKLSFIDASKESGIEKPSFSNGAAYADLDMDGDLDIIVNNIDEKAFVIRNDITGRHWLEIDVEQSNGNKDGIGTTAYLHNGDSIQVEMLSTNKGFLSSSEPIIHFGLGASTTIDSIILQWPEGDKEIMRTVKADQRIIWKKGSGTIYRDRAMPAAHTLFSADPGAITWQHKENEFVDFKREKLLPYMLSREGPCMSTGDVNGDKLIDIYAGNGAGYSSDILLQNENGTFTPSRSSALERDSAFEDCGSILEDLDGDGDLDLVVISGGNAAQMNDPLYMTRYYTNDGKGIFTRSADFPIIRTNAGAILALDYDGDKDLDIFIGGKCSPGSFPTAAKSYVLRNDHGHFTDVTKDVFPLLDGIGMISDIKAGDLDRDGKPEIVVAGEWFPISIFSFEGGKYVDKTAVYGLEKTSGWWKCLSLADIDGDGDLDIFAGNIGLNNRLRTSVDQPVTLVTNDFDKNGSLDPIMCFYYNGKEYPYAGRDLIIAQIPRLKKKFLRYTPYASATLEDIFTKEELEGSKYLTANTFMNTLFINENKKFKSVNIPYQAQLSPVFDIIINDFNEDGKSDILLAGNFLYSETETGEMDAGNGTLLLQNGDGTFRYVPNREHGFWAQNEARELKMINLANGMRAIVTGNNNGPIEVQTLKVEKKYEQ